MPTARLAPAFGPKDDGRGKTATDNRPAEVAMGGMSSYTARPDGTAARHTDARSLAVPVPRGTLIPTAPVVARRDSTTASSRWPATIKRGVRRRTIGKVYAPGDRMRIFFHIGIREALRVPEPPKIRPVSSPGQKARSRRTTAGRDHERRRHVTVPDRHRVGNRLENLQERADKPPKSGRGPTPFDNLGMFGGRSKFLAETPGRPCGPA
jgi:hypothetical protein